MTLSQIVYAIASYSYEHKLLLQDHIIPDLTLRELLMIPKRTLFGSRVKIKYSDIKKYIKDNLLITKS